MLNSEVIFLEIVTGTSDFGGNILKIFQKKTTNATRFFGNLRSAAEGNTTIFFFGLILNALKVVTNCLFFNATFS